MGKLVVFIIIFLLIGAFFIISQQNLDIKKKVDQQTFFKSFSSWLGQLGNNTIHLTASAVKLEWLPEKNSTGTENNSNNSTNPK
ncbi:hypothetical protein COS75_01285 [Candidatus Pacearchaeota archaeon CG06_land_8_20_14_3_00_35_12]|nr:MAG: hypothetical protein COS75_01285 [Candidatus Pacearchaeota archaeon CG06_land_8_20_14_3_00_35_12]